MHELLQRLFRKRGIETIDQLDEQEQETFKSWQAVLSKEELTTKDIKNFCQSQIDIIESRWADYNLEQVKKAEFIPYHHVYKTLLNVVDSPKKVREALEQNLQQLLKQ